MAIGKRICDCFGCAPFTLVTSGNEEYGVMPKASWKIGEGVSIFSAGSQSGYRLFYSIFYYSICVLPHLKLGLTIEILFKIAKPPCEFVEIKRQGIDQCPSAYGL